MDCDTEYDCHCPDNRFHCIPINSEVSMTRQHQSPSTDMNYQTALHGAYTA